MQRLRKKKTHPPPHISLAEASSAVRMLIESMNAKIALLDSELNRFRRRLATAATNPQCEANLRRSAAEVLRRKRIHEIQRDRLAALRFNVDRAALVFEGARATANVVAAMRCAHREFEAKIKEEDLLGPDDDARRDLADDVAELVDGLIDESSALNFAEPVYVDEADLEAELDMLEDRSNDGKVNRAMHPRGKAHASPLENKEGETLPSGAMIACDQVHNPNEESASENDEGETASPREAAGVVSLPNNEEGAGTTSPAQGNTRRPFPPKGEGIVAREVRRLNSMPAVPVFPQTESDARRRDAAGRRAAIVPDAKAPACPRDQLDAGKKKEEALHQIKTSEGSKEVASQGGKQPGKPRDVKRGPFKLARFTVRNRSESPSRSKRKTKRPRRKRRKITLEERMRDLSLECIELINKLKGAPKFSPEWVLSKLEIKLVTEELEHLYAKSVARQARVE